MWSKRSFEVETCESCDPLEDPMYTCLRCGLIICEHLLAGPSLCNHCDGKSDGLQGQEEMQLPDTDQHRLCPGPRQPTKRKGTSPTEGVHSVRTPVHNIRNGTG